MYATKAKNPYSEPKVWVTLRQTNTNFFMQIVWQLKKYCKPYSTRVASIVYAFAQTEYTTDYNIVEKFWEYSHKNKPFGL